MRRRIRAWFQDQSLGVVIPVGVVLGFSAWELLLITIESFVMPLLLHWGNSGATANVITSRLTFHLGNVEFDYTSFVSYAIAFLVLSAVVYYIFVEGERAPDNDIEMRDCPECKNSIWVDATRCSFCTAVVEPLLPSEEASGT